MRNRSGPVVGALLLTFALSACASATPGGGAPSSDQADQSSESGEPAASPSTDPIAHARAQAWLDAAALPPAAVRSASSIDGFDSFTGWPCGPVEELEGFWTVPGATVSETANWLIDHPTADLVTTAVGHVASDPSTESATVGYIPEPGAQEGIVYTVAADGDGVAVRAEVAALTESAVCPTVPDGGMLGAPGQG